MTLKEKVTALYQRVFNTDEEPGSFELAKLVNIIMQAAEVCPDAEEEVGKDVLDVFKRFTKRTKRSCDVKVTELQEFLNTH